MRALFQTRHSRLTIPAAAFCAALCAALSACSTSSSPTAPASVTSAHASASHAPDGPTPIPVFVIGDSEPNDIGATVNFWGAQWWKNNQMTDTVSNGVSSFKGYATTAEQVCGGTWQSRPGNSDDPPATIDADVVVIVTSTVVKNGAVIHGGIKRIVTVHHDGNYGPNPGHPGSGVVTSIVCGGGGIET